MFFKLSIQKSFITVVGIVFVSSFVGCAKYKPNSFTKPVGDSVEKNDVKASAQLLSESDCRHYFGRRLLKKGYQPVQLYVHNKGDQDIILDASTINMPVENRDYVASRAHLDAIPRVAGWGVGGLFCWPLFIPAVVEAVQVPNANNKLDEDFESRALDMNSKVAIKSNSAMNVVFFVRKENISDKLQFALKNSKTKAVTSFGLKV